MNFLRRSISIRALIALVVIGPIVAASIALVVVSTKTNQQIAEGLGHAIMESAATNVRDEVREYLAASVRVSNLYTRRLAEGRLPEKATLELWEQFMFDDLAIHRHVASICFANTDGDATWLLRHGPRLEVGRSRGGMPDAAVEFEVTPEGQQKPTPLRQYTYEPRQRPWYQLAESSDKPTWTPAYFWFGQEGDDAELGVGYTRAIRGTNGTLRGVLVIDTTVGALSEFLQKLPFAEKGSVFLVDDQQLLVASSHGNVTAGGKRVTAAESEHAAARAVAHFLAGTVTGDIDHVLVDSSPARVRIVQLEPFPGIRWKAAILLPEHAFLADAQAAQRRAMALAVLAIAGNLIFGYLLANAVTRPLVKLSQHARKLGRGDFSARLKLRAARELEQLSADLNAMGQDLEQHVKLQQSLALASQVQQALLPLGNPQRERLDVFGVTRYCDSTGGDYYDYIDFAQRPNKALMVAIGDVMGHGVAAALLMATARAALRAGALQTRGLGELMNTVNAVLTTDSRHGRFMTMFLLQIDPLQETLHWSCAGHDSPLLYDPAIDAFRELEGGDVPLGVDAQTRYQEYSTEGLKAGQIIVLGTDGIWEARNARDELFGKKALRGIIRAHAHTSCEAIAREIESALESHFAGTPSHDDITFVLIKVAGERERLTPARAEGLCLTAKL